MGPTGHRSTAVLLAAATSLVAALVGCGSRAADVSDRDSPGPDGSAGVTATPISLDGVTGELVITRQRDLIDRGLVNVMTRNDSGTSLLLSDIELVADTFDGEPAPARTISVRSGRRVAIQVPFGRVDDCDGQGPVTAELTFTSTTADDRSPRAGRVQLDGTDILDTIRAQQCVTRRFEEGARTHFDATSMVDGAVVTQLVLEPTGTSAGLAVGAASGTVLVSVSAPDRGSVELHDEPVSIPLTFVVNRCDPHALAEVTKRYGLDVDVSVDGAAPVAVAIDIGELVDDLDAIVEQCRVALPDE